jgi:hypothetical protein
MYGGETFVNETDFSGRKDEPDVMQVLEAIPGQPMTF